MLDHPLVVEQKNEGKKSVSELKSSKFSIYSNPLHLMKNQEKLLTSQKSISWTSLITYDENSLK
jgi:hypothetical protein